MDAPQFSDPLYFEAGAAPTAAHVAAARVAAQHSHAQAAALVYLPSPDEWVRFEAGEVQMGSALWELYLIKAGFAPKPPLEIRPSTVAFDPQSGHTFVGVSLGPRINMDKALFPLKLPTAPEPMCLLVGQISVAWSDLEEAWGRLLDALIAHCSFKNAKPWEFQKRKALALELWEQAFASRPQVVKYFQMIVGSISGLQLERNLLAHGHLTFRANMQIHGEGQASVHGTLTATGRYKDGLRATRFYTVDELEGIFYVLCHVTQRIENALSDEDKRGTNFPAQDIAAMGEVLGVPERGEIVVLQGAQVCF